MNEYIKLVSRLFAVFFIIVLFSSVISIDWLPQFPILDLVRFDLVLWHIKHCWLFHSIYIYIYIYMICKHIL